MKVKYCLQKSLIVLALGLFVVLMLFNVQIESSKTIEGGISLPALKVDVLKASSNPHEVNMTVWIWACSKDICDNVDKSDGCAWIEEIDVFIPC